MTAAQQNPSKEDIKPAAHSEAEESPLSVEQPRNRLRKRHHESETMKELFTDLARDNQKQFKEQEEKHNMEIEALKRANLDTQHLLTTKTTPAQIMSDHRSTAHFNAMTKPSDTLFDGTPENWPAFEHHLLTEVENPTISWNKDKTNETTTDLLNNRTDSTVEMMITNALTQLMVVTVTKINVHKAIADDHPHEIAPTPTHAVRAAQGTTTKTVHHSMMTKINISISTPDFTQHHRNLTTPRDITRT
jgi:hypothetical protein